MVGAASAAAPSWTDWHVDPSILIGTVVLCAAYAYRARALSGTGLEPSKLRIGLFAAAVLSVVFALASPLHDLGERYLFSAHMAQHLLLTLAMPPLLLGSLTPEMARPLFRSAVVFRTWRFLTRPLMAFAIANGVFAIFHLPHLYEMTLRSHDFHVFEHVLFMATGLVLWWPLMSPLPELPRAPYAAQLLFVFLQVIPGGLIGGLIANTERALYPFYAAAPRISSLTPVQDQQLGAVIMWVGGSTFWLIAFTVIFFIWAGQDMADIRARASGSTPRDQASRL